MTVQVHQTEIVGTEKTTFAEESFSAGPVGVDADSLPRLDDAAAAVCYWYLVDMGRVD